VPGRTALIPCSLARPTAASLDVVEGRAVGSLYIRYGLNPSILSLEEKLAASEGAEAALAFASDIAAESALFFAPATVSSVSGMPTAAPCT
jgi:cystathionine beta-lyase/cystathionine gamma-synthase